MRLGELLDEVALGLRFVRQVPRVFRHPVSVERARAVVQSRQANREGAFLEFVRRAVYEHPPSPYRFLLRMAGCELGDLAGLLRSEGLEGALLELHRRGVYLSVGELKGRVPIRRGSASVVAGPDRLQNPLTAGAVRARSTGGRNAAAVVPIGVPDTIAVGTATGLILHERGGDDWVKGLWYVPGGAAVGVFLRSSAVGAPPERWFTQVPVDAPGLHARYRLSTHALRLGGLLGGRRLPRPEYAPLDDPRPVVEWLAGTLRRGLTPLLLTNVSAAVRACQAALDGGIDLGGAQFSVSGEPLTEPRLALIQRAGAQAVPFYTSIESGTIGEGCLNSVAPDEQHVMDDLMTLVQPMGTDDLFVTSVQPTARMVLLNVALGDHGILEQRACGCALERLGWQRHLHSIRSREKLTAAGMTFVDSDVMRVLDEVLPARFGGAPTHYQLVEEERADGQARLRLVVHPAAGTGDLEAVRLAFLEEIGRGSGAERVMSEVWRLPGLLTVEVGRPDETITGKILHVSQRSAVASV